LHRGRCPGCSPSNRRRLRSPTAIEREQFLILTHAEVLEFVQRKASDYDRWLAGMRRLRAGLRDAGGFLKVKNPPAKE